MSNSNETSREIRDSGTCGECTWTLDSNWHLIIAPADGVRGILEDISRGAWPWKDWSMHIESVVIAAGVVANSSVACMFDGCWNLKSIDLSGLDTSNATDMSCMFSDCFALVSIDLASFAWNNIDSLGSRHCPSKAVALCCAFLRFILKRA